MKARARAGVTLVELAVTLALLGLAAALAVPALTGYLDKGARQQALTEAHACVQACDTLLAEWHAAGETAARYGPDGSAPPAAAAGYHIAAGQTGGGMQPAGLAAVRELAGVPGRVEAAYRAADETTAYLVYTNDRHTVVYSSAGEAAALPGATPEPGGNPNVPPPATAAPTPTPEPTSTPEPAPTPSPTPEPTPTPSPTPTPTEKPAEDEGGFTVWVVDENGNPLDGLHVKITGGDIGTQLSNEDRHWVSSKEAGYQITLKVGGPFTIQFEKPTESPDTCKIRFEVTSIENGYCKLKLYSGDSDHEKYKSHEHSLSNLDKGVIYFIYHPEKQD